MKKNKKLQFIFSIGRDYRTMLVGWKLVEFGIFKIHTFPQEGEALQKHHYKGFIIRFIMWLPFDSYR